MSALSSTVLHFVTGEGNQLIPAAFLVTAFLAAITVYRFLSSNDKEHEFPKLPGIQLFHALSFFQRRHDFVHSNFKQNSGQSFSFNTLHHRVIALTGDDARRVFYSAPGLSLSEGFGILMATAGNISYPTTETSGNIEMARFTKSLNKLTGKTRMQNVLPMLLHDITAKVDKWGNGGMSGRIDPFTEIFNIVFFVTARMSTCRDLTANDADLVKMEKLLVTLQTGDTPTALILPWFPSPARVKLLMASIKIFLMLRKYVEARRRAEPTSDAIDVLIAEGGSTQDIAKSLMIFLFAGTANTGIISCWTLTDLAIHQEWRNKCKKEIQELLSRHLGDSTSFPTICDKLSAIPLEAWDDELPILDACNRESHRLSFTGVVLRRNVRKDINIGGKVVKFGDFLTYSLSEVHLNQECYPEPQKYDPGRWLRPDPAPKAAYPFLGWGAGRHPCPGARLAKLEMKLIIVMFLLRYEYELVDGDGKFPNPLPVPNRNRPESRPPGAMFYFKFKKVVE